MIEDIKIEKNIPLPDGRGKSQKYPLNVYNLEVGDSVFCSTQNMASAIFLRLKRKGFNARTRKWENGFRVWRIK